MEDNILHRKEKLIITTIEIIDELGIQKLSTREIARRQGVSEATLFRHYKSKNELLGAVLDYFSQFDDDIYQSTVIRKLSSMEAIVFLIKLYSEYYENYPAITSIMQIFDVLRYEEDLTNKINGIINKRQGFIKQLVEEAQKDGDINRDFDSDEIADIINGLCREICLKWRLENRKFSLSKRTLSALHIFLDSIKMKDNI